MFPKPKRYSGGNLHVYNAPFITPNLVANVRLRRYCLLTVIVKDLRAGGKQPYPLPAFTLFCYSGISVWKKDLESAYNEFSN